VKFVARLRKLTLTLGERLWRNARNREMAAPVDSSQWLNGQSRQDMQNVLMQDGKHTPVECPDLSYSLGFLVGRELEWVPDHFVPVSFACPLYAHPNASVAVSSLEGNAVAVIGEVIHPDHPQVNQSGIAAALVRSVGNRQAEIDKLVGRFVIIDSDRRRGLTIQSDAIGMRSVYFGQRCDDRTIAASAAKLVSRACHGGNNSKRSGAFRLGYPGIQTPYLGVLRLPPNSLLELDSGALRRFFPIEPIDACTINESLDFALSQAHRVVSGAMKRKPILLSLTAGLDSRTTLAATRGLWPGLTFFTYRGSDLASHGRDILVASDIARTLGLRHLKLDYAELIPDPWVIAAIKDNSFGSHQHKLACAYHRYFGGHRLVHVRTNLMELARSNLYGYHDAKPEFSGGPATAHKMAQFYALAGKLKPSDRHVAAFEQYCALTKINDALNFANAWDLYFVEHRMGAWHSGIVAESDVAFDTIIAFNSRNIIRRFMGVPQETRFMSESLRQHLKRLMPEIAQIPINPKVYPDKSTTGLRL